MSQFNGIINRRDGSFSLYSEEIDITDPNSKFTAPNLYYSFNEKKCGYCVAGVGISKEDEKLILMGGDDWAIAAKSQGFTNLSGHFAGICIDDESIQFFTCNSGLRDLYFIIKEDYLFFTTNYHTLFKVEKPQIDLFSLGGRWLLYNQLQNHSLFLNYPRICAGQKLLFNRKTGSIKIYPTPTFSYREHDDEAGVVKKVIKSIYQTCAVLAKSDRPLELSLSGGLDSRFLLNLLSTGEIPFSAHSFGNGDNLDVQIAAKICSEMGVPFKNLQPAELTLDNAINDVRLQAQYSLLNHPATNQNNLYYYKEVTKAGSPIIIDGGFGELWRRQFFYKLSVFGKKSNIDKDLFHTLNFFRHHRADIFSAGALVEMEKGCLQDLQSLFHEYPHPSVFGIENWIDLIALKTRLPNYYAQEQTMIDGVVTSIMPFVQEYVVKFLYSFPLMYRKDSRFFKETIYTMEPRLINFPLVKGAVTVPFHLGSFTSRIYSAISTKYRKKQLRGVDFENKKLLLLKEYAHDLSSSDVVRNSLLLDNKKVAKVLNYYNGDTSKKGELAWLITMLAFLEAPTI